MSPELLAQLYALGKKTPDEIAAKMPRGWRHCEHTCPLAMWLDEEGTNKVIVDGGTAEVDGKRYDLPDSVSEFICAFDNGAYPELCKERYYAEMEGEEA